MIGRGERSSGHFLGWTAALLVALILMPATPALAADEDDVWVTVTVPESAESADLGEGDITNAEFRWGINVESGSGAFAGGCNFLSAGKAGDAGGVKVWAESDGLYSAADGNVEIVKADVDGAWTRASFATKCLDRSGKAVSVTSLTSHTESQAVIEGGVGSVDADGVQIRWSGSFTAVLYGGMTYWTVSDPVLTMDAKGSGRVTATLSGYATDRDDMGKWAPIAPREVVIAELRGATLTDQGFARAPEYVGVVSAIDGQAPQTLENVDHWGAFPESFMQFQDVTGQAGYWMTTNGQRDRAKVPTTLYVSYDARVPVVVEQGPDPAIGTGALLTNPVSQRSLTPRGNIVSAPAAVPVVAALPSTDAVTVMRDDGSSFIPQASGGLPGFLLPAALTLLSLLIGVLSAMRLAGIPILPWLRRA